MRSYANIVIWPLILLVLAIIIGCQSSPVGGAGHQPPFPSTHGSQMAVDQSILQWIGLALFILGLLAFVFAFFFSSKLGDWTDYLRNGGASCAVVGGGLILIAIFFTAFIWMLGACAALALCGAGLFVYFHRSDILPYLGQAKDQAVAAAAKL